MLQWDFTYDVAGDRLLANAPYENPRGANFVLATLCRETPPRLVITPRDEPPPDANAPPALQRSEEWIAVLAGADIRLRGEPAKLHCSVMVDDDALPAEEERDELLQVVIGLIGDALSCLFGEKMPSPH